MNRVEKTSFDGSDNEAYEDDNDYEEVDQMLRDDFDLSDTEKENNEMEEEQRDRAFFGDDEYPTLKS